MSDDYNAIYGEFWLVKVEYVTDYDGRPLDEMEDYAVTLHGPFDTQEQANEWIEGWPDGDTDVHDFHTLLVNRVRPA